MNIVKKIELTDELILSKIDEYDIYKYYISNKFEIGRAFCSPIRKDNNPSFTIYLGKDNKLHHTDFATGESGRCFDLVQRIFGIDYNQALQKVAKDFGLGFFGEVEGYKKIISTYSKPILEQKRYSFIQVSVKKFTKEDLAYWQQYLISHEDLKREQIYSIKEAYLNRRKVFIAKDELAFAYYYDNQGWKLYFPNRTKGGKHPKWISNIPLSKAMYIENLNRNKNSLICKSLKDYIVCKKVYDNVCYLQNESLGACTDEVASTIKNNSKEVFYGGDSDERGKEASYKITEKYLFRHINPPDKFLKEGIKDWADLVKSYSLEYIKQHFIEKGLLL